MKMEKIVACNHCGCSAYSGESDECGANCGGRLTLVEVPAGILARINALEQRVASLQEDLCQATQSPMLQAANEAQQVVLLSEDGEYKLEITWESGWWDGMPASELTFQTNPDDCEEGPVCNEALSMEEVKELLEALKASEEHRVVEARQRSEWGPFGLAPRYVNVTLVRLRNDGDRGISYLEVNDLYSDTPFPFVLTMEKRDQLIRLIEAKCPCDSANAS